MNKHKNLSADYTDKRRFLERKFMVKILENQITIDSFIKQTNFAIEYLSGQILRISLNIETNGSNSVITFTTQNENVYETLKHLYNKPLELIIKEKTV